VHAWVPRMIRAMPIRCLVALSLITGFTSAEALEIRFYPDGRIYAYELDATRGVRSVLLHNLAVINDGAADVTVTQVDLELTSSGAAREVLTLQAPELDRMAAAGSALQGAGMLQALSFQFGGERLLPGDVKPSGTRVLKPKQALLVMSQLLSFTGRRDALRLRAHTSAGPIESTLAISTDLSRTAFALPLDGFWHDNAGPSLHTHHRWVVPEEFAHDFMLIGNGGLPYRKDGSTLADYYAYGEPVFAAAAGRVSAVLDGEREDETLLQRPGESQEAYLARLMQRQSQQLARGARGIAGNHVLIDHRGEYSLYAHLKPGSVSVKVGDAVSQGQRIGAVGSSGSSTEPHLHFHVCDAADVLECAGIPARFENVEIYGALLPRQIQSGDLVRDRSRVRK
jgi:murein DD-endopeptidase MepM/ murein hydrolase activator NlpD